MSKRAVWKFPLGEWETGMFSAEMPKFAEVLSLQVQRNDLCMWVLVDPDMPPEQRHFVIVGTGNEVTSGDGQGLASDNFVGTFQMYGGGLVFHVFEVFR